jgi:hypothetical protein
MNELRDLIVNVSEAWANLPKATYSIDDIIVLEIVDAGSAVYYPSIQDVLEANEVGGIEIDIKGTEVRQLKIEDAQAGLDRNGDPVWFYFGSLIKGELPTPLKRFQARDIHYKL